MALDLSALEENPIPPAGAGAVQPTGKAMRVKLTDIDPDPNQPRTEKMPEEIEEIGQNIKERGVKLPISVKPHPTKPGKWIINDGELRYLGSKWAKVEDIPVVVDEDFDDFDQVNANEKRFALRPMELAKFIKRKLDEGEKKGEIARRLGKPANAITELLALVEAPACIEAVYTSGRCTSPKTLYELRSLAEKFPERVQEWCDTVEEITRRSVADLGDVLKGKKNTAAPLPSPADAGGTDPEKFRHDEISGGNQGGTDTGSGAESGTGGGDGDPEKFRHDEISGSNQGGTDTGSGIPIKKPLLLVEYDGRSAQLLLTRRPSSIGLVYIKF